MSSPPMVAYYSVNISAIQLYFELWKASEDIPWFGWVSKQLLCIKGLASQMGCPRGCKVTVITFVSLQSVSFCVCLQTSSEHLGQYLQGPIKLRLLDKSQIKQRKKLILNWLRIRTHDLQSNYSTFDSQPTDIKKPRKTFSNPINLDVSWTTSVTATLRATGGWVGCQCHPRPRAFHENTQTLDTLVHESSIKKHESSRDKNHSMNTFKLKIGFHEFSLELIPWKVHKLEMKTPQIKNPPRQTQIKWVIIFNI